MSVSASFVKVSSDPKSPDCFRNAQDSLKNYFNEVVRKDQFCKIEGVEEDAYDESDNYLDLAEHLYSEDNTIVITRIPRDQVEFAIKMWEGMDKDSPIIHDEWSGNTYTAEECIAFFEYCLKKSDIVDEYDLIYLIWA